MIAYVQLDVPGKTLKLSLEFASDRVVCPECGNACSLKYNGNRSQVAVAGYGSEQSRSDSSEKTREMVDSNNSRLRFGISISNHFRSNLCS